MKKQTYRIFNQKEKELEENYSYYKKISELEYNDKRFLNSLSSGYLRQVFVDYQYEGIKVSI